MQDGLCGQRIMNEDTSEVVGKTDRAYIIQALEMALWQGDFIWVQWEQPLQGWRTFLPDNSNCGTVNGRSGVQNESRGEPLGFLFQKSRWKITVSWISIDKEDTERDWFKIVLLLCHVQAWQNKSNWNGKCVGRGRDNTVQVVSSEGTFLIFTRKTLFLASCFAELVWNFWLCRICQKIDTNVYVITSVTYDLW